MDDIQCEGRGVCCDDISVSRKRVCMCVMIFQCVEESVYVCDDISVCRRSVCMCVMIFSV